MKIVKLLLLLLIVFAVSALNAESLTFKSSLLSNPVKVTWTLEKLISGPNEEEKYITVSPEREGLNLNFRQKELDKHALELLYTLKNNNDKPQYLRLCCRVDVMLPDATWWNGYVEENAVKFDPADGLLSTWFPASAAYDRQCALVLGVNPMKVYSRVDSSRSKGEFGNEQLFLALPVYLESGKSFDGSFVVAACPSRYGYHDIIQEWYRLFPAAYRPAGEIHPDVISGETSYMYWKPEVYKYQFINDLIRRTFGGRGSWEWCYKPFVRGGDWAISDQLSAGWKGYTKKSVDAYRETIRQRLSNAEFANVTPMWYLNVCWTEWSLWKDKFPGIAVDKNPVKRRCWGQDVIYGVYCWGSPYGDLFVDSLSRIPKEYPQAKGVGWDSCFGHMQIDKENAGFQRTDPKSFVKGTPMALEAAGIANLLDYNHQNFSGKYRMANVVNFKLVSPYIIGARTDAGLYEGNPMQKFERLMRIESMRARLGSGKALVWHKGAAPEDIRWVDWSEMSKEEAQDAYRQISENTLMLSYYWGAIYAPMLPALGNEILVKAMPELVDLIRQGWQPSPAVDVPDNILAARYGEGAGSRIVVINTEYREQRFKMTFPPEYWQGCAVLAGRENGGPLVSELNAAGTSIELQMEPRGIAVIRVCGMTGRPSKAVSVLTERIDISGKTPFWRFDLKTGDKFAGKIEFARQVRDTLFKVKYNDNSVKFAAKDQPGLEFDSSRWPEDVQSGNLRTARIELTEYPPIADEELEIATLSGMSMIDKVKAGKLIVTYAEKSAPAIVAEANRIADWFRFYTTALSGKCAEPLFNAPSGKDTVTIELTVGRSQLKEWQQGRAFVENDAKISISGATPEALRSAVLAFLNRMDRVYPYYGVLPESFAGIGLAGKTLQAAPFKKILKPTLLEMMQKNKIK